MTRGKAPAAPAGTGAGGRRLWRDVTGRFDLSEHELALLREAARTVDQLDDLAAVLRRDGVTLDDGRVHPALVESRQLRITLARVLAAMRLPDDDTDDGRPQRRGVRGVYVRGVS
jgi:hypothetical protein